MAKTMVATVNADSKRREVAVVVEHEDWQSYSKAVIPKANRAFRQWVSQNIVFGSLSRVKCEWDFGETLEGRTISVIYYTY